MEMNEKNKVIERPVTKHRILDMQLGFRPTSALKPGSIFGLRLRILSPCKWRIKWKRTRNMKWKTGGIQGFKELKLDYHDGYIY